MKTQAWHPDNYDLRCGPTRIRLASAGGVEAGTLLEILDPVSNDRLDDPIKVQSIDRSTGEITLDVTAALSATQFAAITGAPPNTFPVRSREFRMTVFLLRQPDPLMPSRNDTILNTEVFRYLSMDLRHSRYVQRVIGDINGPPRLSDHRPEGESWYIRVNDINPGTGVRLGPEPLIDILPDGRRRPARHPMGDIVRGNDSIGTLTNNDYIGLDDPNPEKRTGLHSLRNIEEISIIACPGRIDTRNPKCADQPVRADALPLRRAGWPTTAQRYFGRRANPAPAVRYQVRCPVSSLAADPGSLSRPTWPSIAGISHPAQRPHARRLCPHRHRTRRAQGAGQRGGARHRRLAAHLEQGTARHPQPLPGEHQRHP